MHAVRKVSRRVLAPAAKLLPHCLDIHVSNQTACPGSHRRYSFDTATQLLAVPELVPFRLTRQLANVLQPHSAAAALEGPMAGLLRTLRAPAARAVLCAVLSVFLREPLGEWVVEAYRRRKFEEARGLGGGGGGGGGTGGGSGPGAGGGEEGDGGGGGDGAAAAGGAGSEEQQLQQQQQEQGMEAAHISSKVALALEKLDGRHPAAISLGLLETLHAGRPYWAALQEAVQGSAAQGDFRASLPLEQGLTPEQQARCLIEVAGDPNVLGRAYGGWQPWV